ncbi:MAG: RCC1 domain-containing protein, partial [Planctomycetota bacterium]|nr:RCC1 domain-containing protein [Planctomycetota bacterium]
MPAPWQPTPNPRLSCRAFWPLVALLALLRLPAIEVYEFVGWGKNDDGQSTLPVTAVDVIAVAAGGLHTLALQRDGKVVAWGENSSGQSMVPAGLSDVVAIAAGGRHSLTLKRDGTVFCLARQYGDG